MRIYKRGQVFWCEFRLDNKHYQYSCKTKDKETAQEIASAIHSDIVRNRFSLPAKNTGKYTLKEVWIEYFKSQSTAKETIKRSGIASKHFILAFKDRNIIDITTSDIKTYQLQRKLEIIGLPKNIGKNDSQISYRSINLEIAVLCKFRS